MHCEPSNGHQLMRVCRRWRNVVLNHPRFWTSVHAKISLYKKVDLILSDPHVRHLAMALEAVRSAPMELFISFPRSRYYWHVPRREPVPHRELVELFRKHPNLDLFLYVEMDETFFQFLLPTLKPAQYANLTSLCIRGDFWKMEGREGSYYFPSLLNLQAEWAMISAKPGEFICSALKHLTIVNFDGAIVSGVQQTADNSYDLMTFLQKSPKLFELAVIVSDELEVTEHQHPGMTHHGVRRIAWGPGSYNPPLITLRPILEAFPEVTSLTIAAQKVLDLPQFMTDDYPDLDQVSSLKLVFQDSNCSQDSPANLIQMFPGLKVLELTGIANAFLEFDSEIPFHQHRQLGSSLHPSYQCQLNDIAEYVGLGLTHTSASKVDLIMKHMDLSLEAVERMADYIEYSRFESKCFVTVQDCTYEQLYEPEWDPDDCQESESDYDTGHFPDVEKKKWSMFLELARTEMKDSRDSDY